MALRSSRSSSLRLAVLAVTVLVPAGIACSSSSESPLGSPSSTSGGTSGSTSGTSGASGGGSSSSGTSGTSSSGASSSGASSSGASSSGSSGDGGGDSGTPPSCTGLAFCDDFEAYTGAITNAMALGPWKASVSGTLTTFAVDSIKPHSGSKSLHVTLPAGAAARGTLNQTKAAGLVTGNNLFGRAMIFYSADGGNGLPLAVHSWLFNGAGVGKSADASTGNVTMNMGGGGAKMQLNYHPVAPAGEQAVQGGTMTTGVWHCVQWQYDGAGATPANAAKVWVDGAVAVDVPAAKGWELATPWTSMDFGFTHYQTLAAGVDVYLDDFAVNGTMVACP